MLRNVKQASTIIQQKRRRTIEHLTFCENVLEKKVQSFGPGRHEPDMIVLVVNYYYMKYTCTSNKILGH